MADSSSSKLSLSKIPSWLAPVAFAIAMIGVVTILLMVIVFVSDAVSEASLVENPPKPESILDTNQLSRIAPRLGLDGIEQAEKTDVSDVSSGPGSEIDAAAPDDLAEDFTESFEENPVAPDDEPIQPPFEGP